MSGQRGRVFTPSFFVPVVAGAFRGRLCVCKKAICRCAEIFLHFLRMPVRKLRLAAREWLRFNHLSAGQSEMDSFYGQILLVAFNYAPENYLPCDGRILNIKDNEALYTLIQNNYGGSLANGTFALPNLTNKAPDPSMHYIICVSGYYPPRPN